MTLQENLTKSYKVGNPLVPDEVFNELCSDTAMDSKGDVRLPAALYSLKKQWGEPEFDTYGKDAYVKTPKLDGVALLLEYKGGALHNVYTRGDGEHGTRISSNHWAFIRGLPYVVEGTDTLLVTGELVLPKTVKNARNVVAGFLGLDVPEDRGELQFVAYAQLNESEETYIGVLTYLGWLGFLTVRAPGLYDVYPTDGEVYRLNSNKDFADLGFTSKYPRGAFALKQQAEAKETTILDIIWQTGKTGRITPVAIMEPVEMDDGATVSRASLSNVSIYRELGAMVGDTARVIRSGGIIPYITGVVHNSKEFVDTLPKVCPECVSTNLSLSDTGLLTCGNPECSAKIDGILVNHCKKLKIKGFGPSTVSKITSSGIESIPELYLLSPQDLTDILGSEKLGNKLHSELEKGRKTTMDRAVASLGIHLIGDTASKKIGAEISTLKDLTSLSAGQIPGIGEKAICNIAKYDDTILGLLDTLLDISKYEAKASNGEVICITGKVAGHTKTQVKDILEDLGHTVVGTVTKACTMVISEDGKQSTKLKQAQERGLQITTLNSLIEAK